MITFTLLTILTIAKCPPELYGVYVTMFSAKACSIMFDHVRPCYTISTGTYTKEDLAAALINMHCAELARCGIQVARTNRVTSIVFFGSFCDWPLTHRLLQENFLKGALFSPLRGVSKRRTDNAIQSNSSKQSQI